MKWIPVFLLILLLALPAVAARPDEIVRSPDKVPGTYIVMFDPETPSARGLANELARAHGVTPDHIYEHAIKGFSFRGPEARAQALAKDPNVVVYESSKLYGGSMGSHPTPAGEVPRRWGLDRIDQRTGMDQVYAWGHSGVGVTVYVIDSGITPTDGVPASRIRSNRNFVRTDNVTDDCVDNFHGTFIAEVIGGAAYGVAKDVTFENYRVLQCLPGHPWADEADVVAGINAMIDDHPLDAMAVANLSLFRWAGHSFPLDDAIQRAVNDNIVVVTIAGNVIAESPTANSCDISPAHMGGQVNNGIITVAATNITDNVWAGSKQGACVDIFAPGQDVALGPGAWGTGTSFAAPHVAGVAAIHLELLANSAYQYRTPVDIERNLIGQGTLGVVNGEAGGAPDRFLYSRIPKRRACCTSP